MPPFHIPSKGPHNQDASAARARSEALVARSIAQSAPVRFRIAASPAEREAVHRLRCQVTLEQGWGRPEQFPEGLERDRYDDRAIQIGGWDGPRLAATCRLVLPVPGELLPTEAAFDLRLASRGRVVDVGRLCVAPAYRERQRRVLVGLLGQIGRELMARSFHAACGMVGPAALRLYQRYRRDGLEVVILGEPRCFQGEDRCPVLIRW